MANNGNCQKVPDHYYSHKMIILFTCSVSVQRYVHIFSCLVPTLFLISTMFTFCFALVPTLLMITFCLPGSCSVPVEVFHEHLLDSIACWVLVHAFKELVEFRGPVLRTENVRRQDDKEKHTQTFMQS